MKVLHELGLADLKWSGMLTPDSRCFSNKSRTDFYGPITQSSGGLAAVLLDDSRHNIQVAERLGIDGILVSDTNPLHKALAVYLGAIPREEDWRFTELQYLRSKNTCDLRSLNEEVWEELERQVQGLSGAHFRGGTLRVLDAGAGLLPLLDRVMKLKGEFLRVRYTAYESNAAVARAAASALEEKGFERLAAAAEGEERREEEDHHRSIYCKGGVTVEVVEGDFLTGAAACREGADLVIGCCFADLVDPAALVEALEETVGGGESTLVYLPITFEGCTKMVPEAEQAGSRPSDQLVLDAYHESLDHDQGHFIDTLKLMKTITERGGTIIAQGLSPWTISPQSDKYMWECMMYFIGAATALHLCPEWDLRAWVRSKHEAKPSIEAANIDILARVKATRLRGGSLGSPLEREDGCTYLLFEGPRRVTCQVEGIPAIQDDEVLLESVCSSISSGTELKIFTGEFDSGAQLDATIKGMTQESMSYPMRYGYSLVGRVVSCGAEVTNTKDLLGRLVFTFAAHASHIAAKADSVFLVPDGIHPKDAIHLPAVETALSLVHDAHPRVGERVCVVGQGMIGLLVTAVLSLTQKALLGIVAVDMIQQRREAAKRAGASVAVTPSELGAIAQEDHGIDVSIEVTGSHRGLQTAIDCTGYGGRVVLGSWYGCKPAPLILGTVFHRSHLRLLVSQVSHIPGGLSDRWDKARRFSVAWELLRQIQPSRLVSSLEVPVERAQEAYEALECGKETGITLLYRD
ncbi:unnamed protein product [Chrysoparadoxa australica]